MPSKEIPPSSEPNILISHDGRGGTGTPGRSAPLLTLHLPQTMPPKKESNYLGMTPAPAKPHTRGTRSISPLVAGSRQRFPAPVSFRGASAMKSLWGRPRRWPIVHPSVLQRAWSFSGTFSRELQDTHHGSKKPQGHQDGQVPCPKHLDDIKIIKSFWWFHYETCLTLLFFGSGRRVGSSFHMHP